jgi:hypothetical protein
VGAAGSKVKYRGVSAAVRQYFAERPGMEVPLSELKAYLKRDANKEVPSAVVHNSISYLKNQQSFQIETIALGRIWRYRPAAVVAPPQNPDAVLCHKRMFEELATTKNGDLLIQDENGKVYRAEEL